jgi:hypothetical protein
MSDTLEKLLSVEKRAAALVAEAEGEARGRTAEARSEVQRRHSEVMTSKAVEAERAIEAERERIAAEREQKNAAYRTELEQRPADSAAFARTVGQFIDKGS